MSEWIKCSERMPYFDGDTKVLAVNTAGYIAICNEITSCSQPPDVAPIETLTGWLSELGRLDAVIGSVTHWMPLPEPPKD